jgi:hypothetical protein
VVNRTVSVCLFLLALLILRDARAQDGAAGEATALVAMSSSSLPSGPSYTALTAHERWHGFWHETILGMRPAVLIFGTAFMDHLGRQPVEWGFNAKGYAHRLENRVYTTLVAGSVHASMAAILHQDTRYLPAQSRGTLQRLGHAVGRTFITQNQSGARVFDISGLGGIYAGGMLPMYWHPHRFSPTAQGVRAGNFGVMFQAGSNILKEFEPDMKRLFKKK